MERHANGYQGLNKDIAYDSLTNSQYIDAKDIRITTADGESMGAFTNLRGNTQMFTIPQGVNGAIGVCEIIGYTTIRNKIILLVADDSNLNSWVYEVRYSETTLDILPGYPVLIYFGNLNFSKNHPIEAEGRYESDCIQRVYWTDYNNYLRSLNIADPDTITLDEGLVDIFPDVVYTQPLLKNILSGGGLFSGVYQVAYLLRTLDGKETLISPPSNLIHVVSSAETLGQSAQYVGEIININTFKALNIIIDTSGYGAFAQIDIFLIFHETYEGTPQISYVETKDITATPTLEFIITGVETTMYNIEPLTYIAKSYPFKTVKTLTAKDNSLLIANLKGSNFSMADRAVELGETFTARTLRYRLDGINIIAGANSFNELYNSDAHWDQNWINDQQYKYQVNGITLGGTGDNITYKFHLQPFTVDGDTQDGFNNVSPTPDAPHVIDQYSYNHNTSFPSNSSPFISGLLKGYKRGETYRFGIVFYNKKGEASFVEYIGDIKFPDISEQDGANNLSVTPYWPLSRAVPNATTTTAYAMGVEFTLNFATCPLLFAEIESYQIVRLERTTIDKRRITSGILKAFVTTPIGAVVHDFDLNTGAPGQILHLKGGNLGIASNIEELDNIGGDLIADMVAYHSPEISYNVNSIPAIITSTSNACMLITGAYTHPGGTTINPNKNLHVENTLAKIATDYRAKLRTVLPVTFNDTEYIKKWHSGKSKVSMVDTVIYTENIMGPFSGYYLRNYYAEKAVGGTLNDPIGGGTNDFLEISKGATGIIGAIGKLLNDPITNAGIFPTSGEERFTNIFMPVGVLANSIPIVDTLLPKAEVYGGFTDDVLESNTFIIASPVITKTSLITKVFGGDIFMSVFTFQSSTITLEPVFHTLSGGDADAYGTSRARTGVFVVESIMNIELANGATLKTGVKYTYGTYEHVVQRQEIGNSQTTYGKATAMYSQNSVYRRENKDVVFFTKPAGSEGECQKNDIRGYLSNVKINGERIDSWTKFGANNYWDVDDYGPINKILNWKDTVFFYQDKAVGAYSINPRAVITAADGVPTELGSGQGIVDHQYISTENGSIHQYGVKATENGIYSFDAIHRKLFLMSGQNSPLSEVKGIHSWLAKLPPGVFLRKENGGDNPIKGNGICIGKDKINDEIIFNFLSSETFVKFLLKTVYNVGDIINMNDFYFLVHTAFETTLDSFESQALVNLNSTYLPNFLPIINLGIVYDEMMQQFVHHPSTIPGLFIENGDVLLAPNPKDKGIVFAYNKGNWGEFFGEVQETSITLVINPNADFNKVLRTFEYNSIVRDNDKVIDRTQTITAFRVQTENQDTGKILFSANRIKRKFDKWRIKIPRNQTSPLQKDRLRSSHFIVTLYFDNSYNKELIMNRLLSYYDVQTF